MSSFHSHGLVSRTPAWIAVVVVVMVVIASTGGVRSAAADDRKSPGLALGLSAGTTVVGFTLLDAVAGDSEARSYVVPALALAFVGPSLGHFYTGDTDLAIGGIALRLLGGALFVEGMGRCTPDLGEFASAGDCVYLDRKPGFVAAGTIVIVGTALAQIVDAPFAAKRHNHAAARGGGAGASVVVAPQVSRGQLGFGISGVF